MTAVQCNNDRPGGFHHPTASAAAITVTSPLIFIPLTTPLCSCPSARTATPHTGEIPVKKAKNGISCVLLCFDLQVT